MDFSIVPHIGLNGIQFGERRDGLRSRIGDSTSFSRSGTAENTDHFIELGLLLSYDADDRLEFIEVTPIANVSFQGVSLIGRSCGEVIADLSVQGFEGAMDSSGVEFRECGFSLFVPDMDNDTGGIVEGVSVFPRGYYG
ncbi:hypothetical protein ACIOHE_21085 [Streptomyces sp. NPDC087851]|uniref:hypothetical protein n=1 Tax=Streptomyces sp. NPDC087851 TaxID=3365810 RepID=UPI0038211B03